MDRRQFIKKSLKSSAAISLVNVIECSNSENAKTAVSFPRRKLGRTDEMLSIIGFGGIIVKDEEQSFADEQVAKAFDNKIIFLIS